MLPPPKFATKISPTLRVNARASISDRHTNAKRNKNFKRFDCAVPSIIESHGALSRLGSYIASLRQVVKRNYRMTDGRKSQFTTWGRKPDNRSRSCSQLEHTSNHCFQPHYHLAP